MYAKVEILLAPDRKGLPNVASVGIACVGYLPRTYTHLTIILTTHADNRGVANMLAFGKVLTLFQTIFHTSTISDVFRSIYIKDGGRIRPMNAFIAGFRVSIQRFQ